MKRKIAIIGSGFSGLSAAAYAAKDGHEVHVFEQNSTPGGRARQFTTAEGFVFDMGPSWYWMPDVIAEFFNDFGRHTNEFYDLAPLDPQFEMLFADGRLALPGDFQEWQQVFENLEPGAGHKLSQFMKAAAYKYEVGMKEFVTKPCHSWWEFASPRIAASALKLDLLTNFRSYVGRYFTHPWLRALMEFPVIFLGASPKNIPALYSLMNYGGYALGTWYPMGGFYQVVRAMQQVAEAQGAVFHFNKKVTQIRTNDRQAEGLMVDDRFLSFDAIIASSDYHHTESLLPSNARNYSEDYWTRKTFAPSCLIYYLGFKRQLPGLKHHTLFFENDLDTHVHQIYTDKKWPEAPLFYACCPSKTDPSVAPQGCENVFLLLPLATGLDDPEAVRESYLKQMLTRLEQHTGVPHLEQEISFQKSYCVSDFIQDYNAYGGNAYGLANTLSQTAVLKPALRNKHLHNLFYTGQLTVPGPGVPPSIISGRIAAAEINKIKSRHYETTI